MNKIILLSAALFSITASVALAGGGGEELAVVTAPAVEVAPVVVVGSTFECDDHRVNDVPRIYEMWRPETNWLRKEWQPRGWNPLNAEYTQTVLATPDFRCDQEWLDAHRPVRTQD